MSTVAGRADTLSRYATQFGEPSTAAYRLPGWLAVTSGDIAELAGHMLQPSSRVTLTYLPEEK
jgi:predicted Zn-dependent peptidase